ncbi:MAG TPA: hypothetical protein DCY74_02480, partial [Clostridiales bacterium]|nr:hypothetical protein [Clostridiales bacterium]
MHSQPNHTAKKKSNSSFYLKVFLIALAAVILTFLFIYYGLGYQVLRVQSGNGEITFFGKVSKGQAVSGTLYYENNVKASLDAKKSALYYANGDIYEGKIVNLMRHGDGKMSYTNSGDVYEGSFINDQISGKG